MMMDVEPEMILSGRRPLHEEPYYYYEDDVDRRGGGGYRRVRLDADDNDGLGRGNRMR